MKKLISVLACLFLVLTLLTACSSSSSSSRRSTSYDYDKGYGYTAPKKGESLNDYIKRQDPDLYQSMQDRWDSLR